MRPGLLLVCLALGTAAPSFAQRGRPTPLLEADLQTGRRVRIDASVEDLDAEFDRVLGAGSGFSTKDLERVLERLRAELRRERPRATPRLVVFLYPGSVELERLKALPQIVVDMELVLDPCERAVCREAVAKHREMVGRAVEKPVLITASHRFLFQTLILSTSVRAGDAALHQVPITDCIAAAARPGGGLAWIEGRERAAQGYEPLAVRAIAQRTAARRVALTAPPRVSRDAAGVHVLLRARGDRARLEQQVIDALAAALQGLRQNPTTPKEIELEVELEVPGRPPLRRFRALGEPVGRYLDGGLGAAALWSSYVAEQTRRKDVTQLDFSGEP